MGQVRELFEMFTQSESDKIDSTGDAEEYKRESETVIFAGALFALLAMLFWLPAVKVRFK